VTVAELTGDGMTQRDVADVLGVDQATVSRDASASTDTVEALSEPPHDADASLDVFADATLALADGDHDSAVQSSRPSPTHTTRTSPPKR
jgi:predicted transcriptional regulator